MLDRDITTTSGDTSTKQHIFSTLARLLPKTGICEGLCCSNLFSYVCSLSQKWKKKELRELFIMAKCKIVSLGNIKIKGKSSWRFFSKLTSWRWHSDLGFFKQPMSRVIITSQESEVWVIFLILKCFLTQDYWWTWSATFTSRKSYSIWAWISLPLLQWLFKCSPLASKKQ